ncbi:exonuclease subunit SbcD [Moritella viscosa]|uniref:Nuclease SbcCD subunit D n=1 Tax=Moritella viscosa TaxID=80854 RepID=A0A090IF30_9GAMM|nr:exonuclease subunit SbcD [Moritella viscosa]CED59402.1 nuclease sbcCD subunit D [Moritella viscosa]SGY86159.1 ATP-dependent dsDNA exonuclease [Moritella viscosa]SGY89149.1 ATP-dependent dsDNA exonuclease [Moritella viscosa]SGY89610.1 ATP-dependent dsDNA exonuclease [Moritella viscosa]SHO00556.1 ATP-dependent dsDNA exonuclease [Moritella viscosa]
MKILHTSDWHLGQHFITKSRANEHSCFMAWLLEQVELHQVDAVIVAGDIFDTGTPPSYARELYNSFVVAMSKVQCQLIILAGNHDSVATLNESKQLLSQLNTRVISSVSLDLEQQVLELMDRQGEVGALLCAVPFVRPRDVMQSEAWQSGTEKQQRLGTAITEHYAGLYKVAQHKREQLGDAVPIIATGHLTALGVSVTESVRDIYIGTLEAFPANQFPAADYIALGHIHRAQKVAKSEHIRYSGSPIPLSFDEVKQQKSVNLVNFVDGKFDSVIELTIPQFQPMQVLKGNLESIEAQLAEFKTYDGELLVWLSIEVQEQDYLTDLQTRIEMMTIDLPVEVLQVRRARKDREQHLHSEVKETLTELSVSDVFQRCLQGVEFNTDAEIARKSRIELAFKQIVEQVEHATQEDKQ